MNFRRARTVYVKELIDILRDHRTLAAMLVAPIVLYPLLMIGGIQAVSSQAKSLKDERIIIGFERYADWDEVMKPLLQEELVILERERAEAEARGADEAELAEIPEPLGPYVDAKSTGQLQASIIERQVHCGVIVERPHDDLAASIGHVHLTIVMQPEELHSEIAARRLEDAVLRVRDHRRNLTLQRLNIDPRLIEPIVLQFEKLLTAGSLLGLILPFILVLMTVTGAIYPAIDLTAGERERGTLESLMVCPVPVIDLIVGKFMAVTTIAISAAALNIASVSATVYFGGLHEALLQDTAGQDLAFPFWAFPVVLFALIPFAVLMSAIMIAVCSCARTFKEAQNYIMPVILMVLVPGGIAALPGSKLEGVMIVMPVANMVLLTSNLLSGATVLGSTFAWVILSTSFYAAVAVAVAAQVFGKESVLFADTLSFRSLMSRRLIRPRRFPSLSGAGLYAAVLFPIWFYVQNALQMATDEDMVGVLHWTAVLMPVFFLGLPVLFLKYWKISLVDTFNLSQPSARYMVAAVLMGLTAWVPAHELLVFQEHYIATPQAFAEADRALTVALTTMPAVVVFVVLAVVPAVSEEFFFRGFLFNGVRSSFGPWKTIVGCAVVFGAFHYFIFRFPVTMALGTVLGWLCWRSRSIWPGVVTHALHNGFAVMLALAPGMQGFFGLPKSSEWAHLPLTTVAPACILLLVGVLLVRSPPADQPAAVATT
ncbi:MAG: ABC transporter permease subunit/CPBP intramembrane protease [Phycisphaerae bacterium]